MQGGQVELLSNRGQVVRIPMQELSASDQRILASSFGRSDRLWVDNSGRYQRQAKFARVEGRTVVLKSKQGREIPVPFHRLSSADQCMVKQLWKRPIPEVLPGDLPAPQQLVVRK